MVAAAVLLDGDGKISGVKLDELETTFSAGGDGAVNLPKDYRAKRQKGDDYPLAAASSLKKGWAEQADAFADYLIGKTPEEVSMLKLDNDGRGTDADLLSGCTIAVDRYRDAISKACSSAKVLGAAKGDRVSLGIEAVNATSDVTATDDKDVNAGIDVSMVAVTLDAVEEKFGDLLPGLKWLNFGGGHHITRPGYDLATLEACIARMQEKYGVQVYLEPGEAWALNAGYLVTTVLDTQQNGDTSLAILDMSAACHTPDVIEMPYRPPLPSAGEPGEKACTIRLGGPTCLAGDVVGDYSFAAPLAEGDKLIFGDMAIYTTCKNNTFNGMPLPPIWAMDETGSCRELVKFGYEEFKGRLGRL